MLDNDHISEVIKEVLGFRSLRQIPEEKIKRKHAGVLIPLFEMDGSCNVVFTQRTNKVTHHKGQISFPGGSFDEEDGSLEETVLREAWEEIGLKRGDVEILGRIDEALTLISSFIIHPFVGLLAYPYDFVINKAEVERIINVPLSVFNPKNSKTKKHAVEYMGVTFRTAAYEYNDDLIWGATARMMENFMNIVGQQLLLHNEGK